MGFFKNLIYSGMIASLLGTSACTLRSPTMPQGVTVTANQTMFANTGTNYTLRSTNPGTIEYKRPCDSSYTASATVPMTDGCYGTLETKVNGMQGSDLMIYKGEQETDNELFTYLSTQYGTGPNKLSSVTPNFNAFGYNYDAICARESLGSGIYNSFYVVRVGNNTEEAQINDMRSAVAPIDLVVINPNDDQTTVIQNYLNQF